MSASTTAVGAWPVSATARSVAIMGGSFDPVHVGHVWMAAAALDAVGAEMMVFIPAARSPHKEAGPSASPEQRVEMLRLALADEPRAAVSTIELDRAADVERLGTRGAPSYTVDTLREIRARTGATVPLWLVIGADQARSFHGWRQPREILSLARPAVVLRAPDESPEQLLAAMRDHWTPSELEQWRKSIIGAPLIDASATELRELLGRGEYEHPRVREAMAPAVVEYVRLNGLYRKAKHGN